MLVWYSNNTFQVKDTSIQRTNAIVPSHPLDGESTVYQAEDNTTTCSAVFSCFMKTMCERNDCFIQDSPLIRAT